MCYSAGATPVEARTMSSVFPKFLLGKCIELFDLADQPLGDAYARSAQRTSAWSSAAR